MKHETDQDHFDEMTDFLTREAKLHVLDSLSCVFHNEGYSLEGNTGHNDVQWLANRISMELYERSLECCSDERKREIFAIARVAKDCIPALAERMAARYIRVSKAIRAMEKIARAQKKKGES